MIIVLTQRKAIIRFYTVFILVFYCQKQDRRFLVMGTVAHCEFPDCGELLLMLPPLYRTTPNRQILSTWDKAIVPPKKLIARSPERKALMRNCSQAQSFGWFSEEWERYLWDLGFFT